MRLALFDFRQTVDYRLEILSGLTVAMALIPEAVAFAVDRRFEPFDGIVRGICGRAYGKCARGQAGHD